MPLWVCFLGFVVLFWKHLHNSIQDMIGRVTLSQPDGGKDPPRNDPTTIKTQLHPGANINGIKGIPRASSSGNIEATLLNLTDILP